MTPLAELLQQGAAQAWLFIPTAVLLGLAAAASHTLVVWVVALLGLHYAGRLDVARAEGWFQLASAVIVVGIALWMLWRLRRERRHAHQHHDRGEAVRRIDTGEGVLALELVEDGVPPRWRLRAESGSAWPAGAVTLETRRPDGSRTEFSFVERDGALDSVETIPEPHAFEARLRLAHPAGPWEFALAFEEAPGDAHQQAHAEEIRRRFAGREVTTGQIVLFGLTGGLVPCPAAITVLLLCLQLREVALGATLVLGFSAGLALVMVAVGVAAAVGLRQAERRWSARFDVLLRRAPYASASLVLLVGLLMAWHGLSVL